MAKRLSKSSAVSKLLEKFHSIDKEICVYYSMQNFLEWDEGSMMPTGSVDVHARMKAVIDSSMHRLILSKELSSTIKSLKSKKNYSALGPVIKRKIGLYEHKIKIQSKIPSSYIEEMAQLQSKLYMIWIEARKSNSFKKIIPGFKRMIELKRQMAKYVNPKMPAYDVLLDEQEYSLTGKMLDKIFGDLKVHLLEIIKNVQNSPNYERINSGDLSKFGKFDPKVQWEVCEDLSRKLLVHENKYIISKAIHPFMVSLGVDDCRVTTSVREDPMFSFGSTAHECGHAMYAMNHDKEYDGTILISFNSVGVAVHESQSRMWENIICNGIDFWTGYYPYYQSKFPQLKNVPLSRFYEIINQLKKSFIRIESDEVTYCLHVIIRYELEKAMIEGKLRVEDLEKEWNKKYKEYLGITPKNVSEGVLQDMHWFLGAIGYFPTYALGNIHSASIYGAILKENNRLKEEISNNDFANAKNWLIENMYRHAGYKTSEQLLMDMTGKYLDIGDYVDYLKDKFYSIYGIKK